MDQMLRFADLPTRKPTRINFVPDAQALTRMAQAMGVSEVRKLRLVGAIAPTGGRDWQLDAELGATVVQPCAVTLAPVVTRVDVPVTRRFLAQWEPPATDDLEMPEDTSADPLPEVLDIEALALEELALAVPDYPRADGAELGQMLAAPEGVEAMTDEAAKPFAGLAALKGQLKE